MAFVDESIHPAWMDTTSRTYEKKLKIMAQGNDFVEPVQPD